MLYLGKNITAVNDQLQQIDEGELYQRIINPSDEVRTLIEQLKTIRTIDAQGYANTKRRLPYFVCAHFDPPARRGENFASIDSFVIDVDHINDKGLNLNDLRMRLCADSRVRICFVSPSGDGLKLLFRLKETCYDKGKFRIFYHNFANQFAAQYGIEQVIDTHTCDVTRACFLSFDPDAHHNFMADDVDFSTYFDESDPTALFDQNRQLQRNYADPPEEQVLTAEPDDDVMTTIKMILSKDKPVKIERPIITRVELDTIIDPLCHWLTEIGLNIVEVRGINYGKQIAVSAGMKRAECNVFYGKRGFSVVEVPRAKCNPELNAQLQQLIARYLEIN